MARSLLELVGEIYILDQNSPNISAPMNNNGQVQLLGTIGSKKKIH